MKARGVSSVKRKDAKRARVKKDIFTRFISVTRQHVGGHVDKKPVRYFMHRPIQTVVLWTLQTVYKPLAPVEQNYLEFLIPGNTDTYIDLDIN